MTRLDARDATNFDADLDTLATGDDIYAGDGQYLPLRMRGESRAALILNTFARTSSSRECPALGGTWAGRPTRRESSPRVGSEPSTHKSRSGDTRTGS